MAYHAGVLTLAYAGPCWWLWIEPTLFEVFLIIGIAGLMSAVQYCIIRGYRDAEASAARRSQVRTVDRSERIRTYNFPENRIADHRTGYKSYNLDQVMDGALEPVVQSCIQTDEEARLAALGAE